MRSIDRLELQKKQKAQQKKNLPPPDEETDEEMERIPALPLNRAKSIFDHNNGDGIFGGINSAPSIFTKKAVFRTED